MWSSPLCRAKVLVWLAEPLLDAGVRATLCAAGGHPLVVIEGSGAASTSLTPDVVITDWPTAVRFARRDDDLNLPSLSPHARILALCGATREHSVASGLRMGVHGVLRMSCTGEELVATVLALARGSTYVCPELAPRGGCDDLTFREDQVLRLLALGQCNKTIARHLGIAVGTVKTHVKAVLAKLNASSRTEAASLAVEGGMAAWGKRHTDTIAGVAINRLS